MSTTDDIAPQGQLPDIAAIVGRALKREPRERQPILLAQRERVSAARYRAWASGTADADRRSAFLACAGREEEIARRVEALYPDSEQIQAAFLAKHPDLASLTAPVYARHSLAQQFIMHSRAERFGATTWRSFATDEPNPAARAVFLDCALLEEESAAFLESISGHGSGATQKGERS